MVNRDALTVTPKNLPGFPNDDSFTLVANPLYNVATPILLTLLERFDNLGTFLVMVQKEVADRLSEKCLVQRSTVLQARSSLGMVPRNVRALSGAMCSGRHRMRIPLVLFKRYEGGHTPSANNPDGSVVDRENAFRLIDAAFGQRRKTLYAALKKIVPRKFRSRRVDPTRRAKRLPSTNSWHWHELWARCRARATPTAINNGHRRGPPGENESDPARRQGHAANGVADTSSTPSGAPSACTTPSPPGRKKPRIRFP